MTTVLIDGYEFIVPSNAVRAVGRFNPNTPTRYVSSTGCLVRVTRAEAEADYVASLRSPQTAQPLPSPMTGRGARSARPTADATAADEPASLRSAGP